mgnify:CR=1 FL=1
MLRLAVRIGLKPHEYWDLTPKEFKIMLDDYQEKQKEKTADMLYLSWHSAAFQRSKKIPKLADIMSGIFKKKPKTSTKSYSREEIIENAKKRGLKPPK